jgi:hypothetical protein
MRTAHLDWDMGRGGTTGWIHLAGLIGVMPMPDPDGRNDLWRVIAYDPGDDEKRSEQKVLDRLRHILPERTQRTVRVGDAVWLFAVFGAPATRRCLPSRPDSARRGRGSRSRPLSV